MRTAKSETERRSRERTLAAMTGNPENRNHGTWYGYVCGCRCERCEKAYRKCYAKRSAEIGKQDVRDIKNLLEERKAKI